jgi:hypothetical protein
MACCAEIHIAILIKAAHHSLFEGCDFRCLHALRAMLHCPPTCSQWPCDQSLPHTRVACCAEICMAILVPNNTTQYGHRPCICSCAPRRSLRPPAVDGHAVQRDDARTGGLSPCDC